MENQMEKNLEHGLKQGHPCIMLDTCAPDNDDDQDWNGPRLPQNWLAARV